MKACLWPLLASGKGIALTARQQGENVLKFFLYWNKFQGKITIAPTAKFLDHKVVWKIIKKHGGDGKHREDSAVKWKVALGQGYHAWCKFVVTKLKHVYIQGLDWINTTKTVQWPNVLTLDGVGVLIEAFPLPDRQEDLEQHDKDDDTRSFPTQKVFEANAKKNCTNKLRRTTSSSRSSWSPTAQPSVTPKPTCASIRSCGPGWRSLPSSAAVDQTPASKNAWMPCSRRRRPSVRTRRNFRTFYCSHSLCFVTDNFFSSSGEGYSRGMQVYTYKDMYRKYNPRCVGVVSLCNVFIVFNSFFQFYFISLLLFIKKLFFLIPDLSSSPHSEFYYFFCIIQSQGHVLPPSQFQ